MTAMDATITITTTATTTGNSKESGPGLVGQTIVFGRLP